MLTGYLMFKNYLAGGWGVGEDWEFGINRCKLLYRMDKQQHPPI